MENNKKTLILSIVGVLVLIIAVVGVSFAMYTFSAQGQYENQITVGTVTVAFDQDNTLSVTNQYVKQNSIGGTTANTDSKMTFNVKQTANATMTNQYELYLVDVTGDPKLTTGDVMITAVSSNGGVSTATGVTILSLAGTDNHGPVRATGSYKIGSGTLTGATDSDSWTLYVWVKEDYVLPGGEVATTNVGTCSNTTYTTAATCEANDANWTQTKVTTSGTLTFKVGLDAKQVTA